MEELVLKAKKRTEMGTGVAKRLRRQGLIPGILYGGSEVVPLTFAFKDLQKILSTKSGENTIFQLNIEGAENRERNVIVRELQRHLETTPGNPSGSSMERLSRQRARRSCSSGNSGRAIP